MLSCGKGRTLTATVAALSLAVLAVLPAEHMHLGAPDHDPDHAVLIHRHYEAHHLAAPTAILDHQDGDQDVEWLASFFTTRETSVPIRPPGLVVTDLAGLAPQWAVATVFVSFAESAHDPPWAAALTLRGPPFFLA